MVEWHFNDTMVGIVGSLLVEGPRQQLELFWQKKQLAPVEARLLNIAMVDAMFEELPLSSQSERFEPEMLRTSIVRVRGMVMR